MLKFVPLQLAVAPFTDTIDRSQWVIEPLGKAVNVEHFADRLWARCRSVGGPVCVGIDPVYERLPQAVWAGKSETRSARHAVEAIERFVAGVLEAVAGQAACVKFQSACFERYLWPGVEAYHKLIDQARALGLIVIADAKRGDIDVSAAHYAAGCLEDPGFEDVDVTAGPDALTVNAYFGADGLRPFLEVAARRGKGVFALVRTSNPSSDTLQGLRLADGRSVAEAVAMMIQQIGALPEYVGAGGYSLLGAVVGATKAAETATLRELMPQQWFLVPGYGAQGGTAQDLKNYFKADGSGAIITASRSIVYAFEKSDHKDWQWAVAEATVAMKHEIAEVLPLSGA